MLKVKQEIIEITSDEEPLIDLNDIPLPATPKVPIKQEKPPETLKRKLKDDPERKDEQKSDHPKKKKKKTKQEKREEMMKPNVPEIIDDKHFWTKDQLLSELEQIDHQIALNIIRLFSEDNTIPFIARYRKELTGGMTPDKLRDVKKTYDEIVKIKNKATNMIETLENQGKLDMCIKQNILAAKTMGELEHIYAPFRVSKHTLAQKARQLGLAPVAENILNGRGQIDPASCIVPKSKGLDTLIDVLHGLQHIIADIICKDREVLDEIQKMYREEIFFIESSRSKIKDPGSSSRSADYTKNKPPKSVDPDKFKLYFDFKTTVKNIQSHQVLAINRGESLKILTVKITMHERVKSRINKFCRRKWMHKGSGYKMRSQLFDDSFEDAYKRLLTPLITREIRAVLNRKAQKAATDIFSNNLRHLLLTQPVKATKILGIDPGFSNGCKMALISERGELLDSDVIYPHTGKLIHAQNIVTNLMNKHNCSLIALGNGTACRETENFLGTLINQRKLPLNSRYSIVNERGASIYSCSEEAIKEFPKLDPNIRSAIYIARCLQDPLCEMVKVDPKHLGVGMYQHDVPEKILSSTLNEVVVECVSFVGVDINTVSCVLLKHVAGLNGTKAEKIIKFRDKFGAFTSRERVKDVPGIGPKSYEQFVGFIRVVSETCGYDADPLDSTWVHPESYYLAKRIARLSNSSLGDVGTSWFIEKINAFKVKSDKKKLAEEFDIPEQRVEMVLEALSKDPKKDYRSDSKSNEPLFKCSATNMDALKVKDVLTGVVTNVVSFGAFVDVGVGTDGLIHSSVLNKFPQPVELGNRVEVRVENLEIATKRINLFLLRIL